MTLYYSGSETAKPATPRTLEQITRNNDPTGYSADADLAAAVNVALLLGKPLLLTGEPGTGKTELARHVAMALGLEEPERFDTKSTSQAGDLFYRFDSLARFHSANIDKGQKSALDFVTLGPLGKAILMSLKPTHPLFKALGLTHPAMAAGSKRSVILIDEIDKAPRDFPNDLLDAIENLRFNFKELEVERVRELTAACGGTDISADIDFRPVVIITSNSEKNLPGPFLRRCVYYHIEFPKPERLRAIVAKRAGSAGSNGPGQASLTTLDEKALAAASVVDAKAASPLLRSTIELFWSIRAGELTKPPSTAELIDWVRYLLRKGARASQDVVEVPALVYESLGVLVKSVEDLAAVRAIVEAKVPRKR